MNTVDVFMCTHPTANCELFLPFNRSMIVYEHTRLGARLVMMFAFTVCFYSFSLSLSLPPFSTSVSLCHQNALSSFCLPVKLSRLIRCVSFFRILAQRH